MFVLHNVYLLLNILQEEDSLRQEKLKKDLQLMNTLDGTNSNSQPHSGIVDWNQEVVKEEQQNSGYNTDSILSRGRGGYGQGPRRSRSRGGYSSNRNSGL